jgi:hypothetical protein
MIKPGQIGYFQIPVQNPATGAAIDADATPTAALYRNGALDGAVSVTIARAALGSYGGSFPVPTGYAAGDDVQVRAQAIVAGVQSPPVVVFADRVDSISAGLYSITMTVRDAVSLNPLVDALVVVKDSTGATVINVSRTSAAGVTIPALDAGTYQVLIGMTPGYTSLTATLVVTANAAVTYDVQPIVIGASGVPNTCRVYGYEYLNGSVVVGRIAKAQLINLPQTTTTAILEGVWSESTSDANGLWYFDAVIGKTYRFLVREAGINVSLIVPDQTTYDLRSAL